MSAADPLVKMRSPSIAVPRFTVELPSRTRVFFGNLGELIFGNARDLLSPGPLSTLGISSGPGEFWPDVFVRRRLPWMGFLQSLACHIFSGAILIVVTRFLAMQPHVIAQVPAFEHSQVIYYSPSEELPPLDTRETSAVQPAKADPEFSRQPIISVPRESDNRLQTIVTPPKVKLRQDLKMPNMVAWGDEERPRLAIPDTPLMPAAETRRMPAIENGVVSPPPDAVRVNQRRNGLALQNSVVAPPPELRASNSTSGYQGLQPDLIAPPPAVQASEVRSLGTMDIASSAVIAPAPRLPVAAQRMAPGGKVGMGGAGVVPPPPSVANAGTAASGSKGRTIALNLHPSVSAPPETPAGNRRGTFAATPEGHLGASGSPGSSSGTADGSKASGTGSKSDLPSGLYVGKAERPPSTIAGTSSSNKPGSSVNPNLLAAARPPTMSTTSSANTESEAKLSEAEKTVFAGRKFYSLTLNMPNLNSAGGSWIIRFAELKRAANTRSDTAMAELSQPMATKKVDPAYPTQLMRENVGGTVILYAVIHSDGHVDDVRVLRGVDDRLDRYAAEALTRWKFQPATKNGSPVAVEATFQIPFHPARVGTNF